MSTLKDWLTARRTAGSGRGELAMETGEPVVEVDADLADLIPQYLDNRWSDLKFARQLLAKGDFTLLARMGHRIRGSAASYGFAGLGQISKMLEDAAQLKDPQATGEALARYEAFLRTVRIEYI